MGKKALIGTEWLQPDVIEQHSLRKLLGERRI